MNILKKLSLFIILVSLATPLFARAQSEELAPPHPDLRSGVLNNGLAYHVMENDKPEKNAYLQLVVKAGSLMEDDDQQGLAHFLEHMVFRGTENYPGRKVIETLEELGIEMGPDLNAFTTHDSTVYEIEVKTAGAARSSGKKEDSRTETETKSEQFLKGLDILREFAFHAELNEESFDVERNVVIEEWRLIQNAEAKLYEESKKAFLDGSRFVERDPIGKVEILKNAPLDALKRFYREWYRPDLMVVIAVGDFDADYVEGEIKRLFESYSRPSQAPRNFDEGTPTPKGTQARIIHDPEATDFTFSLSIMKDAQEKYDNRKRKISVRDSLIEEIFSKIINDRLREATSKGLLEILEAFAYEFDFSQSQSVTSLYVKLKSEKITEGIRAVMQEIQRVKEFGFLPSEIRRAKIDILEDLKKSINEDISSSHIGRTLYYTFDEDSVMTSRQWYYEATQDFLPSITREEVEELIDDYLVKENRTFVLTGPSVPALTELEEDEVLDAALNIDLAGITPWLEEKYSSNLVPQTPQPGQILRRETIPGLDILVERWELSNGAVVYVIPNDNDEEKVIFESISLGGLSLVEDEDWITGNLVNLVARMGIGEFSKSQLEKNLTGKSVDIYPYVGRYGEGFNGGASTKDLESLFQLIYLHHTRPYRDETSWRVLIDSEKEETKNEDSNPQNRFFKLVKTTLYDNHLRARFLEYEDYEQADLDKALRIYRERFSDSSDFSYVFVGDFSLQEMARLTEQWIASIPSEYGDETWQDRGIRLLKTGADVSLEAGKEPLGVVFQAWTGNWDGGFRDLYVMQSLAISLRMRLTELLRENLGGTYGIGVWNQPLILPDKEYSFRIYFSCDPDKVESLSRVVLDTIQEWRNSGPDEKIVKNVVAIQKQDLSENLQDNRWLKNQVALAIRFGFEPSELADRAALYESLNAEIIQEAALRYLNDENYVRAVLYPEVSEGVSEADE